MPDAEKDTPACLACAWEAALQLPRDTYKDHTCDTRPIPPDGCRDCHKYGRHGYADGCVANRGRPIPPGEEQPR